MPQEYSQKQLERMVNGAEENPNVQFYEKSTMNPDESRVAKKRVYHTRLMIKKTQPGLADFAAYVAQPADLEEWPDEYQYFLNTQGDVGSPGIDIIPGLAMDVIQELRDIGVTTITKLCEALTLPAHLQHAQASARRLNEVLHHEQSTNEAKQTEDVSATDRRIDPDNVGQSVLQRGTPGEVNPITGGPHTGRRLNGGEGYPGSEDQDSQARRQEEQAGHQEPGGKATKVGAWDNPNWDLSFG